MKKICNLQITEADTDFFSKSLCNCLPAPLAHSRKGKHTSKLVGKFGTHRSHFETYASQFFGQNIIFLGSVIQLIRRVKSIDIRC